MTRKKSILPYLFLLPAVLVLLLFSYLPTPYALYLSLMQTKPTGETEFIGGLNYERMFKSSDFWESFGTTFRFMLLCTAVMVFLGVLVALILNRKMRGTSFYLSVMFIPWVISDVVVGSTWRWLLNADFGVLNYLLGWTGFKASDLLMKPDLVLVGVVIVTVWRSLSYTTLLVLAGLQSIPNDCIEASKLDGCSGFGTFRHITFPLVSGTVLVVTLINIINCINQSGMLLILTNGGPVRASETLAVYLYKEAFRNYQLNAAASLSIVLAAVNFVIAAIYLFVNQKRKGADI